MRGVVISKRARMAEHDYYQSIEQDSNAIQTDQYCSHSNHYQLKKQNEQIKITDEQNQFATLKH
eukprot:5176703-Amphidinium_carterae.1